MRGAPDSHPEYHRQLCWYHFRKWLFPNSQSPMPTDSNNHHRVYAPNPEPGGFLDDLHLVYQGGKRPFVITRDYRYDSPLLGHIVTVPAGYETDFASVPWLFRRILPKNGPYTPAAVIHDWLFDLEGSTGIDSKTANKVFREAMELLEVPSWKRAVMYRAVKWFGPRFDAKEVSQSPTN